MSGEFLGELRGVFLTDSVPGMACSERSLMAAEISSICSKSLMEGVVGVKVRVRETERECVFVCMRERAKEGE